MNFAFKLGLNSYRCMNEIEFPIIIRKLILPKDLPHGTKSELHFWFSNYRVAVVVQRNKNEHLKEIFLRDISYWKELLPNLEGIAIIEIPRVFIAFTPDSELQDPNNRIEQFIKEMGIK